MDSSSVIDLLYKIAETLKSPGRRAFLLGAAGKAIDAAPAMAMGTNGLVLNAIGLGTGDVGLGSVSKAANTIGNAGVNIAKARHYRIQRVNGTSAPAAAANTYVASKIHKYKSPMINYNKASTVKKGLEAANAPVSKVMAPAKGLSTIGKAIDSGKKGVGAIKKMTDAAKMLFRYYR